MEKPDFVAIDFEHATPFKGSVCSVGIVSYKNGEIIDKYSTLIKPPKNEYNFFNSKVNLLTPNLTKDSPSFKDIYPEIKKRVTNNIVVAHNAFQVDKHCLLQAMKYNEIAETLNIHWKCTYVITKAKLSLVAKICNIELDHHQALSDANACGEIYKLHLSNKIPQEEIDKANTYPKKKKKFNSNKGLQGDIYKPDFENAKNKNNPFYMKKVVLTSFSTPLKDKIKLELKNIYGADIDTSISKKTNYMIVGDIGTPGPKKFKDMKENIEEGRDAQIMSLETYYNIVEHLDDTTDDFNNQFEEALENTSKKE